MPWLALELPEPDESWTVPVIVGLAVLALLSLVKRLVVVALLFALVAGGFVAYQSGALDEWVEKGEQELDRRELSLSYPPVMYAG